MTFNIDQCNFLFGNASQSGGGIISGVVDTYAELPKPASNYDGQFYAVRNGTGGALAWVPFTSIYKYPAGLTSGDEKGGS